MPISVAASHGDSTLRRNTIDIQYPGRPVKQSHLDRHSIENLLGTNQYRQQPASAQLMVTIDDVSVVRERQGQG